MEKLNKAYLVESISEVNELSKAEAERQLNNVLAGLENAVSNMEVGDKLQLVGLLTFEVKHVAEKQAHNPKDPSQKITVPAKNKLKVKVGKKLQDLV